MLPPSPLSEVAAEIVMFSAIVRLGVWMLISPALPVPWVSTVILPPPVMFTFSGAVINMLPPLPESKVRAEMKPDSLNSIFSSGLSL